MKTGLSLIQDGVKNQRASELSAQCSEHGISNRVYQFIGQDGTWIDLGGADTQKKNDIDTQRVFSGCPFKICITLEDGILARCSRATVSHYLQGYAAGVSDFVIARGLSAKVLKKELFNYLEKQKFMEACRYCNGAEGVAIEPAVQISRD